MIITIHRSFCKKESPCPPLPFFPFPLPVQYMSEAPQLLQVKPGCRDDDYNPSIFKSEQSVRSNRFAPVNLLG